MSTDEKPTVELPSVPQWAIELTREVKGARADIGLVSSDLSIVKERLTVVEMRVKDGEERAARTSSAVRGASAVDLEHEAQLSQERAARESLAVEVRALSESQATQLAILSRLDKVASNPLVKTAGAMMLTALVTWLASHGVSVPR
jgi:hypothetical protein